jgi:uncharacterized lipoprotein YddW (UPF0748 family)
MTHPNRPLARRATPFLAFLLAALAACSSATAPGPTPPTPPGKPAQPDTAPRIAREFRGLWVATVGNIDWPSKPGLTVDQQRTELAALLDRAASTGINAIVLHVRPAADAVYRSELEPWGAMLTGTQGVDPGWDPLDVAVREAHARGMELHAWINPFRLGNTADSAKLAATHFFRAQRPLARVYGTQLWMDPGEPGVHDHTMRVVRDIVSRYDVDAVHMDDYFYPYQQAGIAFPDSATYARYGAGMSLDDWRRDNVNRFVARLYREVHETKPWVRVGISPFGIWRPGNPPGITGLDAYASIYADARKWLADGSVDYLAPQLYWRIDPPQQSYPVLLDWWIAQSTKGRHVWPGLAAYRLWDGSGWASDEILNQVRLTRQRPAGTGHILYNTTSVLRTNGGALADQLERSAYAQPAVPPANAWLDATAPAAPTLTVATVAGDAVVTPSSTATGADPVRWWVFRWRGPDGHWSWRTTYNDARPVTLAGLADSILVNAVDRVGNMSADGGWGRR